MVDGHFTYLVARIDNHQGLSPLLHYQLLISQPPIRSPKAISFSINPYPTMDSRKLVYNYEYILKELLSSNASSPKSQ